MGKEKPAEGKFVASVKVGPKGQIIVPKEVRDMFHIQPGDMLLMLADMASKHMESCCMEVAWPLPT